MPPKGVKRHHTDDDTRQTAIYNIYLGRETRNDVAKRLDLSWATVDGWYKRYQFTGLTSPCPPPGPPAKKLTPAVKATIGDLLREDNGRTYRTVCRLACLPVLRCTPTLSVFVCTPTGTTHA